MSALPNSLSRPHLAARAGHARGWLRHQRKRLPWRAVKNLFIAAAKGWVDDRASSMGAALAYYTTFSMAPLLLIVISVAGFFFGQEAAQGALLGQMQDIVGGEAARMVQTLLASSRDVSGSLTSMAFGAVGLVMGATTVFGELQADLNRIWKLPPSQKGNAVEQFVRTRLISFGLVIGIGFLLVVSLLISAVVSSLTTLFGSQLVGAETLLHLANFFVSFGLVTTFFAAIYRVVPDTEIPWSDTWIGAGVTALLFTAGKTLIGLYLGKVAVASSFGAAGTLVVTLVWIYYAAQIFLFGASFTYQYARRYGSHRHAFRSARRAAAA